MNAMQEIELELADAIGRHVAVDRQTAQLQASSDDTYELALRLVRAQAVLAGEELSIAKAVARLRTLIDEQKQASVEPGKGRGRAMTTADVMAEVLAERVRQDAKWGEQNHPDGTGPDTYVQRTWTLLCEQAATYARQACDDAFAEGQGTWRHILDEEVAEACAAPNAAELRAELIQVAAVAVNWIEAIDRRCERKAS